MEMLLRGYLPLSRIPTNAWLKSRKCASAVSNRALNMLIFLQVRALTRVNYRSHIYFHAQWTKWHFSCLLLFLFQFSLSSRNKAHPQCYHLKYNYSPNISCLCAQRNVQKQCNTSKKEHYYAIYSATGIGKKTENRRNLGSPHFRTNRKTGWSWFILWSCHHLLHIGPLAANSSEITNVPLGVHYWGRGFLVNFLKCSKYSCIIAFTTGKKHRSIRDWKMKISWIDRIYLTPSYGSYGTSFLFLLFFVFSLFYISLTSL